MAGVSYKVFYDGLQGSVDKEGRRSYTVPLIVTVDSGLDGPNIVLDYLAAQGITIGLPYSCGNDSYPLAFLQTLTPARIRNSTTDWLVQAQYAEPEEEDPQDPGGQPTEEPEEWIWDIVQGYATWQEPVWKAPNKTQFPHPLVGFRSGAYQRAADTWGPVVNSAGVVLDPPLMRDRFDKVLQITTYSREYQESYSSEFMGAINSDWVQWSDELTNYYGVQPRPGGFGSYSIKCTNASATFRRTKVGSLVVPYWAWSWEFRFKEDTWWESVLDRGIAARAAEGMADGLGGQLGEIPEAAAPIMPVVDGTGRRVPELVLFDGGGLPLTEGDPSEATGVYFDWQVDDAAQFSTLPFPIFKPMT